MESSPLRMDCRICMDLEFWFYSYFWGDLGLIVGWFWRHVYGMFCGLEWEDIVADGQGLFQDGFGSKIWLVPELPRSSLARRCMEARLLRGWAQNCNPRVCNCVGFYAIA